MYMKSKPISIAITLLLALSFLAIIPVAIQPVRALTTVPTIAPLTGYYKSGQVVTMTVTFAPISGAGPYTATFYINTSPSCGSTVLVTVPVAGSAIVSGGTVTFTAPSTNSYICVGVTDASDATTTFSGVTSYGVVGSISSYINNDENKVTVDLGQSITLTSFASGGAPPYSYQWYGPGGDCTAPPGSLGAAISGATSASYKATPASTTTYEVVRLTAR
jgi:hypothetical protein